MPNSFFEEMDQKKLVLITHNLMSFNLQDFFSQIHLKDSAIVLCPDSPKADIQILKNYSKYGIRYYRTFISNEPPPFEGIKANLRIGIIHFIAPYREEEEAIPKERKEELLALVKARNPEITDQEFEVLISGMSPQFLKHMTTERLTMALDMFFRAKTRDQCQYEVRYNEDWEKTNAPSMQIVLAWRNAPKYNFLYLLAETILRHKLNIERISATYIDPYNVDGVLIMSLGLHGLKGKAAWDETDIPDFLREFVTIRYFLEEIELYKNFVETELVSGTKGHLLQALLGFVHQTLVHSDPYFYSYESISEALTRHPELTVKLTDVFEKKFHPSKKNLEEYHTLKQELIDLIEELDTGHATNDLRRKNVLLQGLNFIDHVLKCNYYRNNKTDLMFRIDPQYLEHVPFERKDKFPELPYAIFYCIGMNFLGFHVRFKDISRGGLRTVITEKKEQFIIERNNVFQECYNLAYTQHKKNKDIPEGGAKAVILMSPSSRLEFAAKVYDAECKEAKIPDHEREQRIRQFLMQHRLERLHHSQRSFVDALLTLVNCKDDGKLKSKDIIDYWKRPEYIYLGPDENMHDIIIEWIANESVKRGYKPGRSFITGKARVGINHKAYGVTSWGVNVYMQQVLLYLGIDPKKDPFTVKISGGPDGDVAGNQIMNLYKYFKDTAKLLALVDVSGTIYDPEGLSLPELAKLFKETQAISHYPPELLHDGGFLLDKKNRKEQSAYSHLTLCYRKKDGKVVEDWLSGNEMNHLYRHNVHQVKTDIFIPGGGRPRTLNSGNYKDFLDETGKPTSNAIVEGANLYLTPEARKALEKLGVIIIKDSSCNKGGVICSSFEVLSSLALDQKEFLQEKDHLVKEILDLIEKMALDEAKLLLQTHQKADENLTDISDIISERINSFKYHLLDYLESIQLSDDPKDPLIRCLLLYAPKTLREKYKDRLLKRVPDMHKKAIIACYIASHLVYNRGLVWSPSIVDVLPLIAKDPNIIGENRSHPPKNPDKS